MTKEIKDFSHRLIMTCISVALVVILLIFANYPLVSGFIALIIVFLTGMGVWEYKQFVKTKNFRISPEVPIIFSMIFIAAVYFSRFFTDSRIYPIIVLAFSLFFLWLYHFKEISNVILKIATSFFGICYVAVPLGMFLSILFPPQYFFEPYDGRMWVAYLIAVTKMTDIGAYVFGKLIKGKKIAPQISPGKTYSGTIGGIISALITSAVFYRLQTDGFILSILQCISLGIVIGIMGQIGDLAESLLKRDAQVKDSNRLPGFGGVLDMLDSLLFTIPVVYFYLYM